MSPLIRRDGRREQGLFLSKKRQFNQKIKRAVSKVRRDYAHLKPPVVADQFFGAPHVDPKYLTIYLFFKDDAALEESERLGHTQLLRGALVSALREECYPQESVSAVQINFASKKSVNFAGGLWHYFN